MQSCPLCASYLLVFHVVRAGRKFYFKLVTIKKIRHTAIRFDRNHTFSPNSRRAAARVLLQPTRT